MNPADAITDEAPLGIRLKQAYDKHADTFRAMPPAALAPINVDVGEVFTRTVYRLKQLGALRQEVLAVSHMNLPLLLLLDEYLLALGHAHALYCRRSLPPDAVQALFVELSSWRTRLRDDSELLVRRRLLPGERRVAATRSPSRARVGFEVLASVERYRLHWAAIHDKTELSEADLEAAASAADRLLTALGERNVEAVATAVHMRLGAFNMFVRAYDELRRGVSHLRWHEGDLEKLLPSVYARRKGNGKRRNKKSKPAKPQGEAPSVATPCAREAKGDDDEWPFSDD